MTVWQRLGTFGLVLVTTAGATFMVLFAPGSGSLEAQPVRVIYDLMAAAILLPWLSVAIVRPSWRPTSRLLPALLVVLTAFAVSSVTSRSPRLSFEMLGYAVLLVELYLLLVVLMRRRPIRVHLERLALVLCLIACVLYLLQVAQAWVEWWGLVGRLAIPPLRPGYLGLTFGSPNPVATLVLMLGAFGLAAGQVHGRRGRAAAAAIVGLIAVATFLTGSRGAWLGAIAGLVAVAGVALMSQSAVRARARSLARSPRVAVTLALVAPLLLAAGAIAALSGRLTLDDGGYRAAFARASFAIFESSPVTGIGPGVWGVSRATYTNATDPDYYIPHAHNLYVQTLAEFGGVGIIAGLFAVGTLGVLIGRAIRSTDRSRRSVGFAALFMLVLFAVQQLADVLVNVPALLLAFALPVAWLDAAEPRETAEPSGATMPPRKPMKRVILLGATALTFVIMVGLVRIETAADLSRRGVAAANSGSWSDAAGLFGEAIAIDPALNVYRFELGVSLANAGEHQLAESAFAISAVADDFPYAWLNLAAVRMQLGDQRGAREALGRAERLGLQRPAIALGAGWIHRQLGDEPAAIDAFGSALAQTQALANDPFWSSNAASSGDGNAILHELESRGTPASLLVSNLVRGNLELARVGAAALAATQPGLYEHLIPAWQGDPDAWAALQSEAINHPIDVTFVGWCRLVAAHLGDQAAVQRYSTWLVILGGTDSGLPSDGNIVFDSAEPLPPYILDRYGSLYRREVLAAQVVSSLPQIAWRYGDQAP